MALEGGHLLPSVAAIDLTVYSTVELFPYFHHWIKGALYSWDTATTNLTLALKPTYQYRGMTYRLPKNILFFSLPKVTWCCP